MNCPVCNDELTVANSVSTECNHQFCKTCFWKWIKSSNTCPLCRKSVLTNSEELEEHKYIRRMLEQRTELLSQISYFEKRKKELLTEVDNLKIEINGIITEKNNNICKNFSPRKNPVYRSNLELNNMRLQRILMSSV